MPSLMVHSTTPAIDAGNLNAINALLFQRPHAGAGFAGVARAAKHGVDENARRGESPPQRISSARLVSLPTSRMAVMPQASPMLSSYSSGCGFLPLAPPPLRHG